MRKEREDTEAVNKPNKFQSLLSLFFFYSLVFPPFLWSEIKTQHHFLRLQQQNYHSCF